MPQILYKTTKKVIWILNIALEIICTTKDEKSEKLWITLIIIVVIFNP